MKKGRRKRRKEETTLICPCCAPLDCIFFSKVSSNDHFSILKQRHQIPWNICPFGIMPLNPFSGVSKHISHANYFNNSRRILYFRRKVANTIPDPERPSWWHGPLPASAFGNIPATPSCVCHPQQREACSPAVHA